MAQILDVPTGAADAGRGAPRHAPFGLFKDLEPPGGVVRDLGPNWFAAVMGTGIVANAGAILPLRMPGLRGFATVVWGLAAAMLIGLTAAWATGGLPFALTWWSFTFPVGTCVTGTIALAGRSHAEALRGASVVLYAFLLLAWLVVAARTAHGAATGRLLGPMPPPEPESPAARRT